MPQTVVKMKKKNKTSLIISPLKNQKENSKRNEKYKIRKEKIKKNKIYTGQRTELNGKNVK